MIIEPPKGPNLTWRTKAIKFVHKGPCYLREPVNNYPPIWGYCEQQTVFHSKSCCLMVNLSNVAIEFNKEIITLQPDCYAVVENGGHILVVWLGGVPVIKMDANQRINVLLRAGYGAFTVLKRCFPEVDSLAGHGLCG